MVATVRPPSRIEVTTMVASKFGPGRFSTFSKTSCQGPMFMLCPALMAATFSTPQPVAARPKSVTPRPAWASAVPQAERGRPKARAAMTESDAPRTTTRPQTSTKLPMIR